ncbi:hypothetical protein [Streptomyces chrestomyceticus]|uniref:hypothetical protein n=1 Tax=Streptomyces chrestomyceticus TaxID=68185 RepID=UPI0033DA3CCE
MKRRRIYRDPTTERASLSAIGTVLDTIADRGEISIVMFVVVGGLSLADAAQRLQLTEREAQHLLNRALGRLRHPSRSQIIADEMDGDSVTRSGELRQWAASVTSSLLISCPSCKYQFLPENILLVTGGRPQRYCSNACRQAAYRRRKKEALAHGESGRAPESSG